MFDALGVREAVQVVQDGARVLLAGIVVFPTHRRPCDVTTRLNLAKNALCGSLASSLVVVGQRSRGSGRSTAAPGQQQRRRSGPDLTF